MERLKEKGIQTSIHYPPIHLFKYYRDRFGYKPGMLPLTEKVWERELTLPIYPTMVPDDVKYVADSINEAMD